MSELKKDNSKLKSRQNDHQVDYRLQITIAERDVDIENQGDVYTVQNIFLSLVDVASSCFESNMSGWLTLNRPFPLCRLRKNGRLGKAGIMTGFAQFSLQGSHVMSREQFNLGLWLRIYNYSLLDSQRLPYLIHNPCDGSSGSTLCRHDAGASHANARDQSAVAAGRLCEICRVSHFFQLIVAWAGEKSQRGDAA